MFLLTAALIVGVNAACKDWAGATGTLSTIDHLIAGVVTVHADCSFRVEGLTYDGAAPDVHFLVGKTGSNLTELKTSGIVLSPLEKRAYNGSCYTDSLSVANATWDQLATTASNVTSVMLVAWCNQVKANFGQVVLTKPSVATTNAIALAPASCKAACAAWAGASGALTMPDHGIGGVVTIHADCSFRVEGFTYDGAAPDVHFLASRTNQTLADLKTNGVVLAPVELRAYNGECLTQSLPVGLTWDSLAVVGGRDGSSITLVAWCNQVKANFGQVVLTKPSVMTTNAIALAPASCTNGCNAWAGATASLTMTDHGIGGLVTIEADCSFRVEGFTYDGAAPDVHFLASRANQTLADLKTNGFVQAPVEKRAYNGECLTQTLTPGVTWDSLSIVGGGNGSRAMLVAWCNQVKANFGQAVLRKPTVAAVGATPASCTAPCAAWAGASGALTQTDHGVGGVVTIHADCSFRVEGFTYDGAAPDVHFLVGRFNSSLADLKTNGFVLAPVEKRAYNGECLTQQLTSGVTWDSLALLGAGAGNSVVVVAWCNQVKANFGQVVLTKPSALTTNAIALAPASCTNACNAWAGATASLNMTDHGIGGTITIGGDCTFQVDSFTYDGAAPDVHFLASRPNQTLADLKVNGFVQAPVEKRAYYGECLTQKLSAGVTWDSLALVAGGSGTNAMLVAWCNQVKANFGQALFRKPTVATTSVAALAPASCCNGWVSATGTLRTLEHGVTGKVTVRGDCSFQVEMFNYDGLAPDPHFLVAKGNTAQSSLKTVGVVLEPIEHRAFVNECISGRLSDGVTWDTLADNSTSVLFSIWCLVAKANFGDVVLTKPTTPSAVPALYRPATCTADCSAWAGATGSLTTVEHGVAGTITIHGDCSFDIAGFTYDGVGPDVHFVAVPALAGVAGGPSNQALVNGTELGGVPKRAFANECYAQRLPSLVDWSALAAGGDSVWLAVFCEQFKANFGWLKLTRPATPSAALQSTASCGAAASCPTRRANCLANCMQLDSYYNVWWQTAGDTITIELEAAVDNTDTWVGFGVTDANKWGMVGSDVTITGFFGGKAQAVDYYLSAKLQCNYNAGGTTGVCPDDGQKCNGATTTGTPDVTLVGGTQSGGLQTVRFTRKLTSADLCDRAFTNATAIVWATGPITQGGARLVVNTHATGNTAGISGHAPAAVFSTARFDFTKPSGVDAACMAVPAKKSPPTPKPCMPVALVRGNTSFVATVENFAFYPNPPSWGVSWRFNGVPTPEIVVERGTKYTFSIQGSASHPFYIVDNDKGGREITNETIFVGSETSFGTAAAPFTLEWTPTATTPALVYYQCFTHQKLGWRIYVVDAGQSAAFVAPADSATRCAGSVATTLTTESAATTSGGATSSAASASSTAGATLTSTSDSSTTQPTTASSASMLAVTSSFLLMLITMI